ncbi:MAG: bifunctional diguanylate cyclase/phosphodiesterase [Aquificae bacterium]|nr:bifunctional diguanylate cyclase/phosphodiesterase [Aquificota bacterium]
MKRLPQKKKIKEPFFMKNLGVLEDIPVEATFNLFSLEGKKYVALVIKNLSEKIAMEKTIKRQKELYKTLSEVNLLITTEKDPQKLLRDFVKKVKEYGGFEYVGVLDLKRGEVLAEEGDPRVFSNSVCIVERSGELEIALTISSLFPLTEQDISLLDEILKDLAFALTSMQEIKLLEKKMEGIKLYDELTKLPNRQFFFLRLEEEFKRAAKEKHGLALVVLDIDRFADINRTFGIEKGDKLLQETALRLKSITRSSDFLARVSADEFAVLLISENPREAAEKLVERIKVAFLNPLNIDGKEIVITFSYGVALYPNEAKTPSEFFSHAVSSLLHAKTLGGNKEVFFSKELRKVTEEELTLRMDFKEALLNEELFLVYQPKIDLSTGKVVGVEALIRWKKGEKVLTPDKFLPAIENTDLIEELGIYVINKACKQIKEWKRQGINLKVAINLSPKEFGDVKTAHHLFNVLRKCQEDISALEVEIVETAIMENISVAARFLDILRYMGIRVYIDDFGTGFSSLAYLKKLKVYALKIDREFIKDLPEDKEDTEIVKAIILLAKTLGLKTVAEGVETKEQVEFLKELGCDYAQGYYYSRPLPPDELISVLREKELL